MAKVGEAGCMPCAKAQQGGSGISIYESTLVQFCFSPLRWLRQKTSYKISGFYYYDNGNPLYQLVTVLSLLPKIFVVFTF